LAYLRLEARAQAADGMALRSSEMIPRLNVDDMPPEMELNRLAQTLAQELTDLAEAPVGEANVGPVLFEGRASAQIFALLLGLNLRLPRRPVAEPGRQLAFEPGQLEARFGSRILPEWMDVVDDPTLTQWQGQPLFGHYVVDMEGVAPVPVRLVESGMLRNFLLTRQPVKGHDGSNGRARLPGQFGARQAAFGNLFVSASETVPAQELRSRLLEMIAQQNKPYGLIVRKLDFPSSASVNELRQMAAAARQRGGSLVSSPVLVFRVYADGREELVRGLEFRNFTVRSLRDIVAASDDSYLFHFMDNNAPLAMMGAGGFVATSSVIAPSVLFEDMELDAVEQDLPTLPVVPPPELAASR
jgi:predicted Zn-dependent protease